MIVIAGAIEAAHLQRAVERYVHAVGRDAVPDGLVALLDHLKSIPAHSEAPERNTVADATTAAHGGLMTRSEVARALNVSPSTVTRRAHEWQLQRVGRRYARVSVEAIGGARHG